MNGKYHEIVRIVDITHVKGKNCSAFVISNKFAITAGHCVTLDESLLNNNLKKMLDASARKIEELEQRIIYIKGNCFGSQQLCDQDINKIKFDIEVELKARELLVPTKFKVFDINGKDTKTVVTSYYKEDDSVKLDFALLSGDFSNFNKIKVKRDFDGAKGDIYSVCGFPGGTTPASCSSFKYTSNKQFKMKGECIWSPGISGSPLIDKDGYAVGIASAVDDVYCLAQPLLGMLEGEDLK